jgi:transcriptional regulator of nitric oxide reductase
LLLSRFVAAWASWGTLVFTGAVLILLLVQGDTHPAFHYVPPLVVGIPLLLGS